MLSLWESVLGENELTCEKLLFGYYCRRGWKIIDLRLFHWSNSDFVALSRFTTLSLLMEVTGELWNVLFTNSGWEVNGVSMWTPSDNFSCFLILRSSVWTSDQRDPCSLHDEGFSHWVSSFERDPSMGFSFPRSVCLFGDLDRVCLQI
jgi:hypothetical protein